MSTAGSEGVTIPVTVEIRVTGYQDVEIAQKQLTTTLGLTSEEWKEQRGVIREATIGLDTVVAPTRRVSWDFMLMGRGLSVLNAQLLGNNKEFEKFVGIIYGVGAALRVVTTIVDVYNAGVSFSIIINAILAKSHAAVASAKMADAWATASIRAAAGDPSGLAMVAIGAGFHGTYQFGYSVPGMQKGGIVPETGIYMMHKGETVIPSGTNFSQIFINMTSGAISSNVDVDNMLDRMALRIAQETRRRTGK